MTITTELAQRMRKLSAEIVENLVDCDGADYEAVEQYLKWTQETLGAFVRAALEAKDKQTADLERDVTKLIEERDSAEEALADMYEAVTGGRPEWSSAFGYDDAVEVVGEKTDAWKDQVHEIDMSNSVLQSQLEARKEQQPVAQIEIVSGVLVNDRWMHQSLPNGWHDLYTKVPAPVTDDTRRMDWLVSKTVNVREPMVYGSHSLFWSQTTSDDWAEVHKTSLREQIDAAMQSDQGIKNAEGE